MSVGRVVPKSGRLSHIEVDVSVASVKVYRVVAVVQSVRGFRGRRGSRRACEVRRLSERGPKWPQGHSKSQHPRGATSGLR